MDLRKSRRRLLQSIEKKLVRPEGYVIYFAGDTAFSCSLGATSGYYIRPTISFEPEYLKLSYIDNSTSYKPSVQFLIPTETCGPYRYLSIVYRMGTWQSKVSPELRFGSYNSFNARVTLSRNAVEWTTVALSNPHYGSSDHYTNAITLTFNAITGEDTNAVIQKPDGSFDFLAKVNRTMLIQALYFHN